MSRLLEMHFHTAMSQPRGWKTGRFTNPAGETIRYGFAPPEGELRGTVVLTHGYGESLDLYYETVKDYQKKGMAVWAMDWHGHGMSSREDKNRPDTPTSRGMFYHVRDLDYFTKRIVQRDETRPLVLSTHSMGGHIGMLYLQHYPEVFDGAIMSAPLFDIYRHGLPRSLRGAVKFAFNAASRLGLRHREIPGMAEESPATQAALTPESQMTSNLRSEIRETLKNIHKVKRPTFGWVSAAYHTIDMMLEKEFLQSIKAPVLIGSAGHEDLVDNDAHSYVASTMGKRATLVSLPKAGHNLWHENDCNHAQWWGHVSRFMDTIIDNFEIKQARENNRRETLGRMSQNNDENAARNTRQRRFG